MRARRARRLPDQGRPRAALRRLPPHGRLLRDGVQDLRLDGLQGGDGEGRPGAARADRPARDHRPRGRGRRRDRRPQLASRPSARHGAEGRRRRGSRPRCRWPRCSTTRPTCGRSPAAAATTRWRSSATRSCPPTWPTRDRRRRARRRSGRARGVRTDAASGARLAACHLTCSRWATRASPDPTCQVCGRRPAARRAGDDLPDPRRRRGDRLRALPAARRGGRLAAPARGGRRAAGVGRERRRPRGQMLGGLLSRLPAPRPTARRRRPAEAERPSAARRSAPAAAPGEARPAAEPRGGARARRAERAGTTVAEALARLQRQQPPPHRRRADPDARAAAGDGARGRGPRTGSPGARLTVAWELTWYQWEVGAGPGGPEVRESGKGETIDQLRAADRTWNLLVAADGTLEQRSQPPAERGRRASEADRPRRRGRPRATRARPRSPR